MVSARDIKKATYKKNAKPNARNTRAAIPPTIAPMIAPSGVELLLLLLLWPDMSLPVGTLAATVVAAVAATTSIEVTCVVTVDPPMTVVSVVCTSMVVEVGVADSSELVEFVAKVLGSLLVVEGEGASDEESADTEDAWLEQLDAYSVLVMTCVKVTVVVTGTWKVLAPPGLDSFCELCVP